MAKDQDKVQPYKPEEPVDKATVKKDQQEIREAAKHAAQQAAADELGDDTPISREEAEKEIREAARKVQQEKQKR